MDAEMLCCWVEFTNLLEKQSQDIYWAISFWNGSVQSYFEKQIC